MNTPISPISRKEIRRQWSEYLARYNWQWFCTFTFAKPPHPEQAVKKFRHFINTINRELYGPRAVKHGRSIYWANALEYHKSGVIHFHALLGDISDLNNSMLRFNAMKLWEEIAGYARILPIDDKLEAVTNYVSKYVVKGGEIDLSENLAEFDTTQSGWEA